MLASLVLLSVPISSDVQLGLESWHAMQQKYPDKYRTRTATRTSDYGDYWDVELESIGREVVNSVLLDSHAVHQLCHSIARSSTSTSTSTSSSASSPSPSNHNSLFFHSLHVLIVQFLTNAITGHDAVEQCKQQVQQYNWSFHVLRSGSRSQENKENKEINAFALPGGIISVTDTLLQTLQLSRGEIAALIGHEISHVLYRHTQGQLLKKNLLQTILKAVFYNDGDDYDENFGEAVSELLGNMVNGAKYLGELKFSRMNEYQADGGAWDILYYGGVYNPQCVQRLLEKLHSLERGGGGGQGRGRGGPYNSYMNMSSWDKTHPGTGDRIKVLKQKWSGLNWKDQRRLQALLS